MAKCISFTATELRVLRQCVRIASEDGSIYNETERRVELVEGLLEKIDAAMKPRRASRSNRRVTP